MLAANSPNLRLEDLGDHIKIFAHKHSFYELPKRNCAVLPVNETSCEELAKYVAGHIWEKLGPIVQERSIIEFTATVAEVFGQQEGSFTMRITD